MAFVFCVSATVSLTVPLPFLVDSLPPNRSREHETTTAEIACGRDNLSVLCDALHRADLYDTLDDLRTEFTLFAPNDKAFGAFLDWRRLGDLRQAEVVDLLLTHVAGRVLSENDLSQRCSDLLDMESDRQTRTICKNAKRDVFQKGEGNSKDDMPLIVDSDLRACNGIVHIMDTVILPK